MHPIVPSGSTRPSLLIPAIIVLAIHMATPVAASEVVAPYRGEVIDQESVPISGVFRLTFALYTGERAQRAIWEEAQWVAVHEGMYDVQLGTVTPLPTERLEEELWLGVRLGSSGEITRHRASLQPREPVVDEARMVEIERMSFADIADRALHAERAAFAEDCATLGGRTARELDRYDELRQRIDALARDRGDAGPRGASLGRTTQTLPAIGGRGGQPYDRACPPNHVVTGARGRSGQLIDSMEFICTPLQ